MHMKQECTAYPLTKPAVWAGCFEEWSESDPALIGNQRANCPCTCCAQPKGPLVRLSLTHRVQVPLRMVLKVKELAENGLWGQRTSSGWFWTLRVT